MATYNNIQPWRDQFLINEVQSGVLGAWSTTAAIIPIGAIYSHTAVVAKGFVFIFQGNNSSGLKINTIYRAHIGEDGVLGDFTSLGVIPSTVTYPTRSDAQAILINDIIYIIGGSISSSSATSSVIACPVNNDGSLGEWFNANPLPGPMRSHAVCCINNTLFSVGGKSGSYSEKKIYTAAIDPNTGLIGNWATSPSSLPMERYGASACIIGDSLYCLGGHDKQSVKQTTIYKGVVSVDGTLSTISTYEVSLPAPLADFQLVVTHEALYIIGGLGIATVYLSAIGTDNSLGEFSACPSLPSARAYSQAIISSSKVYLVGGYPSSNTAVLTEFSGGSNDYAEGVEGVAGPLVVLEPLDEVSASAYTWNVGQISVEEPTDDVVGQAGDKVAILAIDEESDEVSVSGWIAVAAKLTVEEEVDSLSISGYSPVIGRVDIGEEVDSLSLSGVAGALTVEGVISTEEYIDRVFTSGINQANRLVTSEDVDGLTATGVNWNVGIVKVREYLDVVSAQMVRGESRGAVSITESVDSASAVAITSNVGKVSITCGIDDIGVVATNEQLNVGVVSITCGIDNVGGVAATEQLNVGVVSFAEPVDVISSQAIVCIGATADITEDIDGINGVLASCNHGTVSIHEELDVVKLSTKIIMPSLGFSRPLSGMSGGTPPPHLGVLHFDRGSIAVTSAAQPIKIEPIHFAR